jgi:DNA-binding MarR family transcriptional regulator
VYDSAVTVEDQPGRERDHNQPQQPRGTAFLLSQIGAHAAGRFAERLAPLDLVPSDVGLLRMIAADPGQSQRDLATALGVVPSRVVALLDGLDRKGLVERRRSATDRRNHEIVLTEKARDALKAMRTVATAHDDDICAGLDPAQREQLRELLTVIARRQGLTPGVHPGYRSNPQARP